jgi:hypothetical protein
MQACAGIPNKHVVVDAFTVLFACLVLFRDFPNVAVWNDSGLNADEMTRSELIAPADRQEFWIEKHGISGDEHPHASV